MFIKFLKYDLYIYLEINKIELLVPTEVGQYRTHHYEEEMIFIVIHFMN